MVKTFTKSDILKLLEGVLDPELPVLSIVDLAMIRDIYIDERSISISITPTYSGCPATETIFKEAENVIRNAAGPDIDVTVNKVLFPPWTTAWLSSAAREKLTQFGIAPPLSDVTRLAQPYRRRALEGCNVRCPRCGSTSTTELSHFSSTSCKALYRCEVCIETFEHMKDF